MDRQSSLVKRDESYDFLKRFIEDPFDFKSFLAPAPSFRDWGLGLSRMSDFNINGFVDKGDKYELNLELPVVGDSVAIEVEDNTLTIKYDEKKENFSSKGSYSYSLPEDIDVSTLKADLGVVNEQTLTVTGEKKKENLQRKIKIDVK